MGSTTKRRFAVFGGIAFTSFLLAVLRVFIFPGVDIGGLHYKVFGDSFWLIRDAYLFTGSSVESATRRALEVFIPLANGPVNDLSAEVNSKLPIYLSISPRYTAIFESRPFASVVLAPSILIFGGKAVSWAIAIEVALAGFLAAILTVKLTSRSITERPLLAIIGLFSFFILPTGEWGSAILFEGFGYIFALALVITGVALLQSQSRQPGFVWVILPLSLLGLAAKSSQITPILIFMLVPFIIRTWQMKLKSRTLNWSIISIAGSLLIWAVLSAIFRWPGLSETLQDTFTNHFNQPDVSNPIPLWWNMLKSSGKIELMWAIDNPAIPIAFLAVIAIAIQRFGLTSLLLLGFAASGIGQFFVHPEPSEFERFIAIGWLAIVVSAPTIAVEIFAKYRKSNLDGHVNWKYQLKG